MILEKTIILSRWYAQRSELKNNVNKPVLLTPQEPLNDAWIMAQTQLELLPISIPLVVVLDYVAEFKYIYHTCSYGFVT